MTKEDYDFIVKLENGQCTHEEEVAGYQRLINSGDAWRLQGCYGRRAAYLIKTGECHE